MVWLLAADSFWLPFGFGFQLVAVQADIDAAEAPYSVARSHDIVGL